MLPWGTGVRQNLSPLTGAFSFLARNFLDLVDVNGGV